MSKTDVDGRVLWERWVCWTCRQKMRLPDHDVVFTADDSVHAHQVGWSE